MLRQTEGKSRRVLPAAVAVLLIGQPVAPTVIVVEGDCTLADAITAANENIATGSCPAGSAADEIRLEQDIVLVEALPTLAREVTLEGNGFSVSRDESAPDFRILHLESSEPIELRNVTLTNGRASYGGGIFNQNDAPVTLTHTKVIGNHATGLGVGDDGGGIYHAGDANLLLVSSTVSNNSAEDDGGGVYSSWSTKDLNLVDSVVSGNYAGSVGGGIRSGAEFENTSLVNSTITGNAAGFKGGGLFVSGYYHFTTLLNSTIIGNSAPNSGGIYLYSEFSTASGVSIGNTIIAGNAVDGCVIVDVDDLSDLGGNFDDDGTCVGASPITPGVDFETTASDNGGPTVTHALLPGSVAIDAGGACDLETDQRGFPRADGLCDSGAYERVKLALSIAGECPGEVTFDATTSEPNQFVLLFVGPRAGSSLVPPGPCGGTELDIDLARRWRTLTTGDTGQGALSVTAGQNSCGRVVQALDRDCSTSNTAQFP